MQRHLASTGSDAGFYGGEAEVGRAGQETAANIKRQNTITNAQEAARRRTQGLGMQASLLGLGQNNLNSLLGQLGNVGGKPSEDYTIGSGNAGSWNAGGGVQILS